MTQKSLNLIKEWNFFKKLFNDKYMFYDEQFYATLYLYLMWIVNQQLHY